MLTLFLYRMVTITFIVPYIIYIIYRKIRDASYEAALSERFAISHRSKNVHIWVHAASLGEVQAVGTILQKFLLEHPALEIIMTCGTAVGAQAIRKLNSNQPRIHFQYAPLDIYGIPTRFLNKYSPKMLVLVESELYPGYLHAAAKSKMKIVVLNGRMSKKSSRRYRMCSSLYKNLFNKVETVLVRNESDKKLFHNAGFALDQLHIAGELKFDNANKTSEKWRKWKVDFAKKYNKKIVIFGSTHIEENDLLTEAWLELSKRFSPDDQPLIFWAPRHFANFKLLENKLNVLKQNVISILNIDDLNNDTNVVIINSFGQLAQLYDIADVAFIGGSMYSNGKGHNISEACAKGVPVVVGPNYESFEEIINELIVHNSIIIAENKQDLVDKIYKILTDDELRKQLGTASSTYFNGLSQTGAKTLKTLSKIYKSVLSEATL